MSQCAYINHNAPNGPLHFMVKGRDRWALECLMAAKAKGCTPITTPGPRWSAYVFNLRKLGLDIETITEPHGGEFSGHHARYVLRSQVTRQGPLLKGGAA
ncbi:hypothetical protein [Pararhodobacter sp. CCB-MM2]|uniref:winged helix domain-containing protein n=1 Tax=Pararhodobacter sp. CCB-MM2 TaxID=1786003 RepID=UPI00082BE363|nr:hypothetical protein [Pararhodobacter sp. CCB-MM2]